MRQDTNAQGAGNRMGRWTALTTLEDGQPGPDTIRAIYYAYVSNVIH